jgi:hypothetical protein
LAGKLLFSLPQRTMNSPDAQNNPSVQDAEALLKSMDMEIALRRAKRLHGEGQRRTARTLYVILVFLMLLMVAGGLWYLQNQRLRQGVKHRPATTRPAPAASAPAAR